MRDTGGSIRLFDSGALERLSHVHPAAPLLFWTPIAGWLAWRGVAVHGLGIGTLAALVVAGVIAWTIAEYALHRYVFHLAPSSRMRGRIQFIIHGVHHEDPGDATRLLMPLAPALTIAALLYALCRLALGSAAVDPFFAAFLAGYLVYDYTHFTIHHRKARTRLGRYLRRHHLRHHFTTPDARWGVTSPLWDWVFGTLGERAGDGSRAPSPPA